MKTFTVEEIYDIIGHLGKSQIIYVFCIGVLQIFTCFQMLLNIFTEYDEQEETETEKISILYGKPAQRDKTKVSLDRTWPAAQAILSLNPSFVCVPKMEASSGQIEYLNNKCYKDTVQNCDFKYNETFTSIATEWNLVCNQKYKVAAVQSLWMAGVMAGALFLGNVADHFGRLKVLILSIMGTITFEGFSAFAPSYNIYVTLRFFGGMTCSLIIVVGFVICQEIVGAKRRSLVGIGTGVFFSIGIAILAIIARYVRHWRILTLITSLNGIVFLFFPFIIPESPRWLVSQGNVKEAKLILENMAKKNGTFALLPMNWNLTNVDIVSQNKGLGLVNRKIGAIALFNHPYILKLTIIQIFSWFVNSAVYYSLTMAAGSMKGNIYISTSLNGLVEIPGCLASIFIIDRFGRRAAICGFMLFGGSICLMAPLIASYYPELINIFYLAGKLSISASFAVIYVHSGELFPTVLRNTGIGIVSVAARIGGIIAPFIIMLNDVQPNLHLGILGIFTLLAGFCNMKLPETLGCHMPESIADVILLEHLPKRDVVKKKGYSMVLQEENEELESGMVGKKSDLVPLVHRNSEAIS